MGCLITAVHRSRRPGRDVQPHGQLRFAQPVAKRPDWRPSTGHRGRHSDEHYQADAGGGRAEGERSGGGFQRTLSRQSQGGCPPWSSATSRTCGDRSTATPNRRGVCWRTPWADHAAEGGRHAHGIGAFGQCLGQCFSGYVFRVGEGENVVHGLVSPLNAQPRSMSVSYVDISRYLASRPRLPSVTRIPP